jgi:hypothetical protein
MLWKGPEEEGLEFGFFHETSGVVDFAEGEDGFYFLDCELWEKGGVVDSFFLKSKKIKIKKQKWG